MDNILLLIDDSGNSLGKVTGPLPHIGHTYNLAGVLYVVVDVIHVVKTKMTYHSIPNVSVSVILARQFSLSGSLDLVFTTESPATY